MPWRDSSLPREIRDTLYDAFVQGVRVRTAGWSTERAKTEGLRDLVNIPAQSTWARYRPEIEDAFWQGYNSTESSQT